ncbi:hypothetical protein HS088_TW18G00167 [Tripterygium wilfordii]|uniref:Uncharacterized protein n=1 Tax=Tripterygium wilfordii TaxID=458696 RepID=A0A7J7CBJ1_TRIWF|nr:hypothetical protein HS088_TW18G00167 [Tripterygium wilfordii]
MQKLGIKHRKPTKKTKFTGPDETEEEVGRASDGGNAPKPCPGASMLSGFGGLGFEEIIGGEDSVGEGDRLVGNKGSMSGDKPGGEAIGAPGRNAGAADMVENCALTTAGDANASEVK